MKESSVFKEAVLYKARTDGTTSCSVCERRCLIREGRRGFCGSRINFSGRLYTITYGDLTSLTFNPIEKKPLFHYWPGSRALSAGSLGCNLRCVFCQNYTISMEEANTKKTKYICPEEFINFALKGRSEGLSFTFNEASCSLLEYIIDCFKLAASKGLYRNLNTNGYMTHEALISLIDAGLDSLCVDIKGDQAFYRRLCNGASPEPVWRNASEAKKRGLHVEMVNLVIPGANDGERCFEEIISRTIDDLGRDTPLHFTRFYPAFKSSDYGLDQITPVETLEMARGLALEEGLEYVYIGNIPGHEGENTYCPGCRRLLIKRYGFNILRYYLADEGSCPQCGLEINLVGPSTIKKYF